jgi:hypothetical protein
VIDNVWKGSNTADIDEVRTNGENLSPLHSGLRSGAVRQARRFPRWWRRRRGSLGKAFTATVAIATRCLLKRLAVLPQAFEAAENAALVAVKANRSLSVTLGDVFGCQVLAVHGAAGVIGARGRDAHGERSLFGISGLASHHSSENRDEAQ